MTPAWLLENVVPYLSAFYGGQPDIDNPALVLAYPLLWAAMSDEMEGRMDDVQRKRIRDAYAKIDTLPEGVNPVVRVHLHIRRVKDLLVIDETHSETVAADSTPAADGTTARVAVPNTGAATDPAANQAIVEQMFSNQQQLIQILANQERVITSLVGGFRSVMTTEIEQLKEHVCR